MQRFTFQIFAQTASEQRLRLLGEQGKLLGERSLPQADIERFVAEVEKDYRSSRLDLRDLGRRLYEWLDGPTERWLAGLRAQHSNLALHVDVENRLRHLPWELLYSGGHLCGHAHQRFTPVRRVNGRCAADQPQPANRPLRVLFMAASPEDVLPVLDFEAEEARILEATRHRPLELAVEESGSLEGLREQVTAVEAGYFDVFHLSGHAGTGKTGKPVFVLEDSFGFRHEADAGELAEAFNHRWPRLLFLSGCRTGQALEQGELPSLCEALVTAGAPAVLGWALPVGDRDASQAAAYLYEQLASGERLDAAVAHARQQLLAKEDSRYWHLLRLYADATPLSPLVKPLKTRGRAPLMIREARAEFLDAAGKVEVCPRERFVGRRRPLQRSLRALKSVAGEGCYAEGVLLHGMGGLGKSSLAARLCDRLPDYRRLVWVGQVDELALLRVLGDKLDDATAIARLNEPGLPLKARLRRLLQETLATAPALFVFDDFEHSLERSEEGNVSLKPGALPVLRDLLAALRETGSVCRVIVTSRYAFPLPGPATLYPEGLESLRGADLEKKTQQLEALGAEARTAAAIKERALKLAAGNPRLLEWLDRAIQDQDTDETALLTALEQKEARFREDVLLKQLVEQQTEAGRRLLALLALYQLPVPRSAVAAVMDGPVPEADLQRAVSLGLVEAGRDPATTEPRYYVSPLLDAALREELDDAERTEARRRAARHLYQIWWKAGDDIDEARALEIHRLALRAGETAIAGELAGVVSIRWVNSHRYREAERLCQDTLKLGEDYRLSHRLARAEVVLGKTDEAKRHYETALAGCPQINAETEKAIVSEFAAIQHNLAGLLVQRGDIERALGLWRDSLALQEQIGDVGGKAATLHDMAGVIARRGDIERALGLWRDSLALKEQIGNVRGKAVTLHQMAGVIAQRGDIERALGLWRDSLALWEQIGDVRGKAATLHNMAWLAASQGDREQARPLYLQSAQALVGIRAWPDLATVLWNLGALDEEDAIAFLGQALWLALHVQVPLENLLGLASALLQKLGFGAEPAPLFAAAAVLRVQAQGQDHPEAEQLQGRALGGVMEMRRGTRHHFRPI
jgi:tetratricopeptide (TPR) repeat protein